MKYQFSLKKAIAPVTLFVTSQTPNAQAVPSEILSVKPNIVVMVADDLTYHDLGCWGNTDVKTPNLDRLAKQGMRLTHCYTPAAVCSPTRQSLYTGLFPVKSGAYPNHSVVKPGVKSLPHYLQPLGYRVGLVGKTHFGPPKNFPFEFPEREKDLKQEGGEETEVNLNYKAAEQFINRDKTQPYCLFVTPHEPHSPWTKGDTIMYNPDQLKLASYLVDTPLTRRALAKYYAEVTYLDEQVGRVMEFVDNSGQAENTLFLFLSEQGSSLPFGKWTLYDAGIRSAAIVRWPNKIKAGTNSNALCQYVDFLPTFIEMAGGKPELNLDGRSILKLLNGQSSKGRDFVFAQQTSRGIVAGPEAYGIRAVADQRWKYILNLNSEATFTNTQTRSPLFASWQNKGEVDSFAREQSYRYQHRPHVELYDLQNDPFELINLAEQPEQKDNLLRLRAALDQWMKEQSDKGHETEMEAFEHQGGRQMRRRAAAQVNPKIAK